jgi:hypothetical protein
MTKDSNRALAASGPAKTRLATRPNRRTKDKYLGCKPHPEVAETRSTKVRRKLDKNS